MGFWGFGVLTKSTRCVDEILLLRSRTKSLRDEILASLGRCYLHLCPTGGEAEVDGVDHAVGEGFGEHAGGIGAVG